jgi:hypothetical protein
LTTCICQTKWCQDVRAYHLFKNSLVGLTKDSEEASIWLYHLEVDDAEDLDRIADLDRPRVWVGHFHQIDFQVESETGTDRVSFSGIDFESVTLFQDFETGYNSKNSPPRPSVIHQAIWNSNLMNAEIMSYDNYKMLNSVNINATRKRKSSIEKAPEEDSYKTPGKSGSDRVPGLRRRREKIYHESYVGMADHLVNLIRDINSHGQNCLGQILFRDSAVRTKRFTLLLNCQCSLYDKCTDIKFDGGCKKWASCSQIVMSPGRKVFTSDVLYAYSLTATPSTKAHAAQLMDGMLLPPPSRDLLNEIIVEIVDPYLVAKRQELVDFQLSVGKSVMIVSLDTGYNSARNAQGATICIASGGRVLFTLVDVLLNAWLKEAALVRRALDYLINDKKIDVAMVEIDDNATNAKIISSYSRTNGPLETVEEPVIVGNDGFHFAKAMGRNAAKSSDEDMRELMLFLQKCCEMNYDIGKVIVILQEKISQKSDSYFKDIKDIFHEHGATSWRECSASQESMTQFAKDNNLLDKIESNMYWGPLITAWNSIFVKEPIKSMSSVRIRNTLCKKTLLLLSQAVWSIKQDEFPVMTKDNEMNKVMLLSYLRESLPGSCFQGDNFSIDIKDVLPDIEAEFDINPPLSDIPLDDDSVLTSIFGVKNKSLKEVKNLNAENMKKLSIYLADKKNVEHPKTAKLMRSFCILNASLLNDIWEDTREAMKIAQKAFIARIGEFKRTLKQLLRVLNEMYANWSMKFKLYFLHSGLYNFIEHCCKRHKKCWTLFWWVLCGGDIHDMRYTPQQDYVPEISSGRGPACNAMISGFFKIIVTLFIESSYIEKYLVRIAYFAKTSVCESYFHWEGIMISKALNYTKGEYTRKQLATYIAFVSRQSEKLLLNKSLVKGKYHSTFTVSAGQKNGRHEKHMLEGALGVAGSDPIIKAAVAFLEKKREMRLARRLVLSTNAIEEYQENETARHLNLGPSQREIKTFDINGNAPTTTFFEAGDSARAVTPFPFQPELLLDDSTMHRIENVWKTTQALKNARKKDEAEDNEEENNLDEVSNLDDQPREVGSL